MELRHTTYVNKPVRYAGIALWGVLGLLLCAAICCFSICLFVTSKGEYKIKALFAESELRAIKYAIEILNPRSAIPAQQIDHYLIPELSRPVPAPVVAVPLCFLTSVAADGRTVVDSGSSVDVEARPELSMW
ncbi:MAG: hypothetical protein KBD64_05230 [Gammaproteobacteria bacterium]|nr:hypothetical protein [Gammaproteobacteria bacterium]